AGHRSGGRRLCRELGSAGRQRDRLYCARIYPRAQGLNAELVYLPGHPATLDALSAGEVDFINSVGPEVILVTSGAFVGMWRERVAFFYSKYRATAAAERANQ